MAGKDKKGGASYLRKWRRLVAILLKFLRWLGKFPRWLVFTEMGWFVVIEVIVVIVLICFFGNKEAEFARLLITGMIAVGGGYSLILATRRAVKFSEQVETAQKQVEIGQKQVDTAQKQVEIGQKQVDTGQNQLFNEQLGRAAELLANEKMTIRQAGIRVLADLAEKTPDQVKLIMQIIYDFVYADALSSAMPRERLDIALGIKMLGFLYNKSGQKIELKKLVEFIGYHFKELDLRDAQLQGVDFRGAQLQGAYFNGAQLQGAQFFNAQLQVVDLDRAQLQWADLDRAQLQWADCTRANFSDAKNLTEDQVSGMIFDVDNPPTLPKGLEQFLDPMRGYKWEGTLGNKPHRRRYFVEPDVDTEESEKLEWSGKDVYEWVAKYLASIRAPKDA